MKYEKKLTIEQRIANLVLAGKSQEQEAICLLKDCISYDAKHGVTDGSKVEKLLKALWDAKLGYIANMLKLFATEQFGYYSTKAGAVGYSTDGTASGKGKLPTEKQIENKFNSLVSLSDFAKKIKEKNDKATSQQKETEKKTRTAKEAMLKFAEGLKDDLRPCEQRKLEKIMATIRAMKF